MMVCKKDKEPIPQLPLPQNFGWELEDKEWLPAMTTLPPAPKAAIQLVKCVCTKDMSTPETQTISIDGIPKGL